MGGGTGDLADSLANSMHDVRSGVDGPETDDAFHDAPHEQCDASSEQHMYVYGSYTTPQSQAVFDELVSSIFTPMYAPLVEARYPVDNSTSPVDSRPQINDVKSDFIYVCPNRRLAALASFHMPGQVYTYWFNHSYEEYDSWGPYSPYCWGVCPVM